MFVCKFAHLYDNDIFLKYHQKPVQEDYFKVENNLFCVADGVTRDDIEGQAVPYPHNEKEVEEWIKKYPNPSGAYEAAKICAENFIRYLSKYAKEDINKEVIWQTIKKVNQDIAKINEGRQIDYLKEDYYCCEAVGGVLLDNTMYCFSIGDCHIVALDETKEKVFETINNHKQFENFLDNIYVKSHPFDWNLPEDRVMIRRDYRNKPDKKYQGQDVSFGALSGEKEAEYYIDVYQVDLTKAKYICAYSDGCEPFFASKEKLASLLEKPETLANEGKERTLVIYENIKEECED